MKTYLAWGNLLFWLGTLAYFALGFASNVAWNTLILVVLSIAATCAWIATHPRLFGTWRGLGLCVAVQLAAQAWLQWQWDLWGTGWQNANALFALITIDSFAGIVTVLVLLLIRRDISVWALATAWLGCPLGLLITMSRYSTLEQLDALALRESVVMLPLVCLLAFLAVGGGVAFFTHFMRLIYLELVDSG